MAYKGKSLKRYWKLDLFLSSGEGRETPTLLGPVERANINHLKRETLCFLVI
jgi:hypothetical protein